MKLEIVDLHSVAVDLLQRGPILDVGCRGFRFMDHFSRLGHPVVGLDPAPDIKPPMFDHCSQWNYFYPWGLVAPGHPRRSHLRLTDDPEARHLTNAPKEDDPVIECRTIEEVMKEVQISQWDLVKLNAEGSEYDILKNWPGPITRQLVVSFHEHTERRRGEPAIQAIVEHLAQWYAPIRHEFDERYCAGRNAWDSVFALKELA